MKKTYKYRAYLNKTTEEQANNVLEFCRQMYNLCLEQRIFAWKTQRKSLSCFDQINQLPELKKEFSEFKLVSAQTLQEVVERLDKSYQGFFRRIVRG